MAATTDSPLNFLGRSTQCNFSFTCQRGILSNNALSHHLEGILTPHWWPPLLSWSLNLHYQVTFYPTYHPGVWIYITVWSYLPTWLSATAQITLLAVYCFPEDVLTTALFCAPSCSTLVTDSFLTILDSLIFWTSSVHNLLKPPW